MDKRQNNRILALLFMGVLMGALDISIVGPAIPAIEESMKVERQNLSWIFSIYVLANLTGISLMAKLSDLYGRRLIYMSSLAIFAAGSLVVGLSDNLSVLLSGRAVQGFGASGIFPVASAVVGDVFPPQKRGGALGLIGAVFGLAFILGPVIAGVILKFFEWNDLFFINLPVALLLILLSSRLLPHRPVSGASDVDWKGIVILGLALSSFTYGINRVDAGSPVSSILSADVLPFLTVSFLSFLILIIVERKENSPVVNPRLFAVRQIRITGLIAVGTGIFQASFVFMPSMAIALYGVSTATASFMLLPVVIATALGSPVSGRLIDRFGSKALIITGLFLTTAGFVILSGASGDRSGFYTGGIFLGLGFSILSGSALRYIMLNEVPSSDRAATQGIITIFVSIGQMTGAAALGTILAAATDISGGYTRVFLYISILSLLLSFSGFFLKNRRKELLTMSN